MSGKSGLEMLEEILRRLDIMDKRLNVIDQNIKAIANSAKITDLVGKLAGTPMDNWSRAIKPKAITDSGAPNPAVEGFSNFKFESSDATKINKNKVLADKMRAVGPKKHMVQGKMVGNFDGQSLPLANISVKIYDTKDILVKETRTNRAGQWMGQLPPGKYVALFEGELKGKPLIPQNRNFEVPANLAKDQKYIEVV